MNDTPLEILLSDQKIARILVGEGRNQEVFLIHKKLLMMKSSYFETRNSTDQSVDRFTLDHEITVQAFRLFAKWVYRDTVDVIEITRDSKGDHHLDRYFDLYFAAGKLCKDSILQDMLMDRIRDYYRSTSTVPSLNNVKHWYLRTAIKSPLRRFFAESVAWAINRSKVDATDYKLAIDAAGAFAMDLIILFQSTAGSYLESPFVKPNCDFHWHKQGRSCDGSIS
ncbi:MAG: hypothetical protein M1836_006972 [Candelina mexicana]|nr:MAG: hypothetical protein M1836_006972 [Candelina mexicana]